MTFVSSFVVFAVSWFIILYCLLPVGIRSQEETGEDIPEGSMAGAPSNPNLGKKAIGATILAALFTALIWYLVSNRILTLGALNALFGQE